MGIDIAYDVLEGKLKIFKPISGSGTPGIIPNNYWFTSTSQRDNYFDGSTPDKTLRDELIVAVGNDNDGYTIYEYANNAWHDITMTYVGPSGIDSTVAVGTTTTLNPGSSATVSNVGQDIHNAIFNFGIPKGYNGYSTFITSSGIEPSGSSIISMNSILLNGRLLQLGDIVISSTTNTYNGNYGIVTSIADDLSDCSVRFEGSFRGTDGEGIFTTAALINSSGDTLLNKSDIDVAGKKLDEGDLIWSNNANSLNVIGKITSMSETEVTVTYFTTVAGSLVSDFMDYISNCMTTGLIIVASGQIGLLANSSLLIANGTDPLTGKLKSIKKDITDSVLANIRDGVGYYFYNSQANVIFSRDIPCLEVKTEKEKEALETTIQTNQYVYVSDTNEYYSWLGSWNHAINTIYLGSYNSAEDDNFDDMIHTIRLADYWKLQPGGGSSESDLSDYISNALIKGIITVSSSSGVNIPSGAEFLIANRIDDTTGRLKSIKYKVGNIINRSVMLDFASYYLTIDNDTIIGSLILHKDVKTIEEMNAIPNPQVDQRVYVSDENAYYKKASGGWALEQNIIFIGNIDNEYVSDEDIIQAVRLADYWKLANPGIHDAPADGIIYGRKDNTWTPIETGELPPLGLELEFRSTPPNMGSGILKLNPGSLVDWGDGSPIETIVSGSTSHVWNTPGAYIMKVYGLNVLGTDSGAIFDGGNALGYIRNFTLKTGQEAVIKTGRLVGFHPEVSFTFEENSVIQLSAGVFLDCDYPGLVLELPESCLYFPANSFAGFPDDGTVILKAKEGLWMQQYSFPAIDVYFYAAVPPTKVANNFSGTNHIPVDADLSLWKSDEWTSLDFVADFIRPVPFVEKDRMFKNFIIEADGQLKAKTEELPPLGLELELTDLPAGSDVTTILLNTNTLIDWGDGSPIEQNAEGITHTWEDAGSYTVRFYSDDVLVDRGGPVFGNGSAKNYITKFTLKAGQKASLPAGKMSGMGANVKVIFEENSLIQVKGGAFSGANYNNFVIEFPESCTTFLTGTLSPFPSDPGSYVIIKAKEFTYASGTFFNVPAYLYATIPPTDKYQGNFEGITHLPVGTDISLWKSDEWANRNFVADFIRPVPHLEKDRVYKNFELEDDGQLALKGYPYTKTTSVTLGDLEPGFDLSGATITFGNLTTNVARGSNRNLIFTNGYKLNIAGTSERFIELLDDSGTSVARFYSLADGWLETSYTFGAGFIIDSWQNKLPQGPNYTFYDITAAVNPVSMGVKELYEALTETEKALQSNKSDIFYEYDNISIADIKPGDNVRGKALIFTDRADKPLYVDYNNPYYTYQLRFRRVGGFSYLRAGRGDGDTNGNLVWENGTNQILAYNPDATGTPAVWNVDYLIFPDDQDYIFEDRFGEILLYPNAWTLFRTMIYLPTPYDCERNRGDLRRIIPQVEPRLTYNTTFYFNSHIRPEYVVFGPGMLTENFYNDAMSANDGMRGAIVRVTEAENAFKSTQTVELHYGNTQYVNHYWREFDKTTDTWSAWTRPENEVKTYHTTAELADLGSYVDIVDNPPREVIVRPINEIVTVFDLLHNEGKIAQIREYIPGEPGQRGSFRAYTISAPGSGSSDHNTLTNREIADQHPISAITDLEEILEDKANKFSKTIRTFNLWDTSLIGTNLKDIRIEFDTSKGIYNMANVSRINFENGQSLMIDNGFFALVNSSQYPITDFCVYNDWETDFWLPTEDYIITSHTGDNVYPEDKWNFRDGYLTVTNIYDTENIYDITQVLKGQIVPALKIKGSVATIDNLPTTDVELNDAYLILATGNYKVCSNPFSEPIGWKDILGNDSTYLKNISSTTQIINSDLAIGYGKKVLFEEEPGGAQHLAIDRDQWGVEVGNEEDELILNTVDPNGNISVNWKDSTDHQQQDFLALKGDLDKIINDTTASTSTTYSSTEIEQKLMTIISGDELGFIAYGRTLGGTSMPSTATTGEKLWDFSNNKLYTYTSGTGWGEGVQQTPQANAGIDVIQMLDGFDAANNDMTGHKVSGIWSGTAWTFGIDNNTEYTFDSSMKTNTDGSKGVADYNAGTITEDATKFAANETGLFNLFKTKLISKINGLFTSLGLKQDIIVPLINNDSTIDPIPTGNQNIPVILQRFRDNIKGLLNDRAFKNQNILVGTTEENDKFAADISEELGFWILHIARKINGLFSQVALKAPLTRILTTTTSVATTTLDCSAYEHFIVTVSADTTITFSNIAAGKKISLYIKQGATLRQVTLNSIIKTTFGSQILQDQVINKGTYLEIIFNTTTEALLITMNNNY